MVIQILPQSYPQIKNKYWTTEKRNETLSKLIEEGKQYHFNAIAFNGFLEQTSQTYFPLTNLDKKNLKKAILEKFIDEKKNEVSVINIIKTKDTKGMDIYEKLQEIWGAIYKNNNKEFIESITTNGEHDFEKYKL